jgi:hypothetical protein
MQTLFPPRTEELTRAQDRLATAKDADDQEQAALRVAKANATAAKKELAAALRGWRAILRQANGELDDQEDADDEPEEAEDDEDADDEPDDAPPPRAARRRRKPAPPAPRQFTQAVATAEPPIICYECKAPVPDGTPYSRDVATGTRCCATCFERLPAATCWPPAAEPAGVGA